MDDRLTSMETNGLRRQIKRRSSGRIWAPAITVITATAILTLMPGSARAQAPMCSVSTPDRTAVSSDFNRAWAQKRAALAAAMDTLKNVQGDLDSLYRRNIGDPGSARELITAMALVAKTTTDLIQDLMPFGSEIKSVVYRTITNGKDIADIVNAYQNHDSLYWIDTGLTLGADLLPIIRALNAMKNLAKNIDDVKDISESRKTYEEQSVGHSRQLDEMQKTRSVGARRPRNGGRQAVKSLCRNWTRLRKSNKKNRRET